MICYLPTIIGEEPYNKGHPHFIKEIKLPKRPDSVNCASRSGTALSSREYDSQAGIRQYFGA